MPARDPHLEELAGLWRWFASSIGAGYCPLYVEIAAAIAGDDELLSLVRQAPPAAHNPPALLAAVHYLLLGGLEHPLAAVYRRRSQEPAAPLFRDLCLSHRRQVLDVLAVRRIQTNEVGRSSLVGPALTWAADRAGAPLHLVDVGCSAGLNMLCDRYRLDYGSHGATGPPDSPVRVTCEVRGGRPPVAPALPPLGRRVGIDLDPPDLLDPDDARWLLACVWPRTGRLERTAAAIAMAQGTPPVVRRGDALDVLPGVLAELPPGPVAVVNTWSFAYFRPDQRMRFVELLRAGGRERPLVWLAAEGRGVVELVDAGGQPAPSGVTDDAEVDVLSAAVFDGARREATVLALVQAHGRWMDWRA